MNLNTADICEVAKSKGWEYCGDVNIEHGGYFFKTEGWETGDAEVVSVDLAEGKIWITEGMVNKLKPEELREGLEDCFRGTDFDEMEEKERILYEIDYCKSQWGIQTSGYGDQCLEILEEGRGPDDEVIEEECFEYDGETILLENLQEFVIENYIHGT